MPKIEPLFHDKQAIGKLMSGTKHKYIWRFKYDEIEYTVEFYKSKRGNRRIFMNGDKLLEVKRSETDGLSYRFTYKQGKVRMDLLIVKLADGEYDLRIGSASFRAQMGRVKIARPTDELGKTDTWETAEATRVRSSTTFDSKIKDPWEAKVGNDSDEDKQAGRYGKQPPHDSWQGKGGDESHLNNPFNKRVSGQFDTRSRGKDPFESRTHQDQYEPSRKTIAHTEAYGTDPWEKKAINIRPIDEDSQRRSPVKAAPLRKDATPPPQVRPPAEPMNVFEMHKPQANFIPDDIFSTPSYSTQQAGQDSSWMSSAHPVQNTPNSYGNPFENSPDKSHQGFVDPFEPSSGKSTEPSPGLMDFSGSSSVGSTDNYSKPAKNEIGSLVDLDNLHLGSNYSPAVAKKIMEANKPVTISAGNVPNIPMNKFQTEVKPSMQNSMNPMMMTGNPMMNPMMTGNPMMGNPMMANIAAMNQYMTGMMMSQMMNNQYMQNPK